LKENGGFNGSKGSNATSAKMDRKQYGTALTLGFGLFGALNVDDL
jgi:hypothetical protein